ncbi:hypothetical protein HETIRDRAFT_454170 [Heterobasidion irregulare TC 32-1]|uniref:Uncharacterized protein n=1 Tax=Heterobasidion irregulare (strain TC 32-1) TaxID=747525 RepID=W4JYF1_HETIT|nr:uncharacterized protein HETIRDRAFT_454170 [Heterobasidion irregulare TC 32-1]ETW78135.1 hypothetical protein HETIRDRAFT_454170 [Heterobasidion irregulare TC 32-1]
MPSPRGEGEEEGGMVEAVERPWPSTTDKLNVPGTRALARALSHASCARHRRHLQQRSTRVLRQTRACAVILRHPRPLRTRRLRPAPRHGPPSAAALLAEPQYAPLRARPCIHTAPVDPTPRLLIPIKAVLAPLRTDAIPSRWAPAVPSFVPSSLRLASSHLGLSAPTDAPAARDALVRFTPPGLPCPEWRARPKRPPHPG